MSKKNGGPVTLFGLVFFVGLLVWINADKAPAAATKPGLTLEQQAGTYMSQIAQVVGVAPVVGGVAQAADAAVSGDADNDGVGDSVDTGNTEPDEKHYITLLPDGAFMRDADTLRCADFTSTVKPEWWDRLSTAMQQIIVDHCSKAVQ